jgi:intracellular multiplication protein IcmP
VWQVCVYGGDLLGQQAENTLYENSIGWGIMFIVLGVLVWLFWLYFDVQVRDAVRWLRYGEMWVVSHVVGDDYTVNFDGQDINWKRGFADTPKWQAEELTYAHLAYFNALAMQPWRIVFAALAAMAAIWCMFRGPNTQFRSHMGLEELIARQSKNFPVIAPFVKFNPSHQPPRAPGTPVPAELPLFAEALGPEEWLAYHSIPVPDGRIDENAAAKAFQKQLGGRWKGANALEPYKQVLLAAFCLKAARKRAQSDEMLSRIAQCWTEKGGLQLGRDRTLLKEARQILADKDLSGKTLKVANQHAFVTTALLRTLSFAREEGGVLAPAQFVWLRGHDRALWYPLNNMGRQSFHIEAVGAMAHYRAEKMTQRPIPVPKLQDAVETIRDYMKSRRARPIPPLDYTSSKKRGIKKAR